jgi:dTDP-4-dehydrorhamnose 3,5-epimerase-like enzyme
VTFEETPFPEVYVVTLSAREDERGFFARQFCRREFGELGLMT